MECDEVWKERWRIYDAISNGIKPEDIEPPLAGWEKQIYEENKRMYDELKKKGIEPAWCPPCDD